MATLVSAPDVSILLDQMERRRSEGEAASITTAFNLVAFVEDDPQLAELIAVRIRQLEERNPSRTIVLGCERRESSVQSEHVQIAVADVAAPQLRSLVHGLLVPNVRTVLMWAGAHVADPRFDQLAELADVIILFTSASDAGTRALREVVRLRGTRAEVKLRDLAFLRLLSWQDTIADFFDDDDLAAELPAINRIEVCSGSLPEAYYFVGWLASRLNWQPCGTNEFCNTDGNTIAIDVRREGIPRRVYSVALYTARYVFGASIHPDSDDLICLTVQSPNRCSERCVPLRDVDMLSLIERAIFDAGCRPIYLETLAMVDRLLEHLP